MHEIYARDSARQDEATACGVAECNPLCSVFLQDDLLYADFLMRGCEADKVSHSDLTS